METTYTLNNSETAQYDSDDDMQIDTLMKSLRARFGSTQGNGEQTTVKHPDGFVIEVFRANHN